MKISDKQRIDWIEQQSRKTVVSFFHPDAKFAHVRAAIDAQIKASQPKPAVKKK